MPVPTVSKLPELVIFGDPLPKSRFSAVSATVFYANRITGIIWPRVHGPQCGGAGWWRIHYQWGLPHLVLVQYENQNDKAVEPNAWFKTVSDPFPVVGLFLEQPYVLWWLL